MLFVCTANLCRSPIAETLFRAKLRARGSDWKIGSAGTEGVTGYPIHPFAARAVAAYDLSTESFASRPLTRQLIDDSDLLLGATRQHVERVLIMRPSALQRTFVLRQFARLLAMSDEQELVTEPVELAARATRARRLLPPAAPDAYDLRDPIGHPWPAFRECADTIEAALDEIVNHVGPA